MINEYDINDWDKESQEAYLKWAKEYGVQHEPWIGQPAVSAAWIAAVEWQREQTIKKNAPVIEQVNEYIKKLEDALKDVKPVSGETHD